MKDGRKKRREAARRALILAEKRLERLLEVIDGNNDGDRAQRRLMFEAQDAVTTAYLNVQKIRASGGGTRRGWR